MFQGDTVIVGAGGIAYAAALGMRASFHNYLPQDAKLVVMDPDVVEQRNWTRQWIGQRSGAGKAQLLAEHLIVNQSKRVVTAVPRKYGATYNLDYLLKSEYVGDKKEARNTLILCMPDNDECRITVAKDAQAYSAKHHCRVVLIVCGNDMNKGQALMGLYDNGKPLVNFLQRHPDVGQPVEKPKAEASCGATTQSAYSNNLTALLMLAILEKVLTFRHTWDNPRPDGYEGYWTQPEGAPLPEMWLNEVPT